MNSRQERFESIEQSDAIDSYFECITACSIDGDGLECLTRCVEVHLKKEV